MTNEIATLQMHPNFNPMRSNTPRIGQQPTMPPVPPHMQLPPFNPSNPQNMQQTVNQFNKRLVHEIQQNHPMLPFNRMNNNHMLLGQPLHTHHPNNMPNKVSETISAQIQIQKTYIDFNKMFTESAANATSAASTAPTASKPSQWKQFKYAHAIWSRRHEWQRS